MPKTKIDSWRIIKGINAGLYLLNKNLRILWANKILCEWFSLKNRDLCRKHCYRVFRHYGHICKDCPIPKVFKTVTTHSSIRTYINKNGQRHYYQLIASPIKDSDNKVKFVLGFLEDISGKVQRDKDKLKLINRLKNMYQHLLVAKKRLEQDTQRLKTINKNTKSIQAALEKKYRKKIKEITSIKEKLKDLIKINQVISTSSNLEEICSLVARFTCKIMRTPSCSLRLIDEERGLFVIKGGYGLSKGFLTNTPLKIGEGIGRWVRKTHKPITIYDITGDSRVKYPEIIRREKLCSALYVPIMFKGKVQGIISTYSKAPHHFTEEEIKLLCAFASQVAVAIEESKYYEDIHMSYFNTIHTLVLAVEARDPYTRGHTERVTKYALQIAKALDMSETDLEILRYAGEVHDIGKISIPDFILNKPARLNPAERAIVELHPVKGIEMLEPLEFLRPVIPIVRHHHERYDGAGYPDGLEKEKIPLMSRILACADAFDAMTSDRPYRRRSLTINEAIREMRNNIGSQFDPNIAHIFIQIIKTQTPKEVPACV